MSVDSNGKPNDLPEEPCGFRAGHPRALGLCWERLFQVTNKIKWAPPEFQWLKQTGQRDGTSLWKKHSANTGALCWPAEPTRKACHEHSLQGDAVPIRQQKRGENEGRFGKASNRGRVWSSPARRSVYQISNPSHLHLSLSPIQKWERSPGTPSTIHTAFGSSDHNSSEIKVIRAEEKSPSVYWSSPVTGPTLNGWSLLLKNFSLKLPAG